METIQSNVDLALHRLKLAREQHARARMNTLYDKAPAEAMPAHRHNPAEGFTPLPKYERISIKDRVARMQGMGTVISVRVCTGIFLVTKPPILMRCFC
jgi:hypothetical protein